VVLDERQGRFEPGRTAEATGTSEVEFTAQAAAPAMIEFVTVLGVSTEPNSFVAGDGGLGSATAGALDLNGDADADVTFSSTQEVSLSGGWQSDLLSGAGGSGTGGASRVPLFLGGEWDWTSGAADTLIGGRGLDAFNGGPGDDTIDARDGLFEPIVFAGPGNDTARLDCALGEVSDAETITC
jgi:hypothetical protein